MKPGDEVKVIFPYAIRQVIGTISELGLNPDNPGAYVTFPSLLSYTMWCPLSWIQYDEPVGQDYLDLFT